MNQAFVYEVLDIFDRGDIHGDLFWRCQDGNVTFSAFCSDTFWWGTADSEPIEPSDLPLLRQTLADLEAVGQEYLLSELFAARKRGMRPMRLWLYPHNGKGGVPNEKALSLFEAAGPERDPKTEG